MDKAQEERAQAEQLPSGDVVAILLQQHARIRDLFGQVRAAHGQERKARFDELRALLAVHETAEEMIIRPVAKDTAGEAEADARNHEEDEANRVLARLERMDLESPEFERELAEFERSVGDHAEHEEAEEFPAVRGGRDEDQLRRMGGRLEKAERAAPTHPHPTTAGSPAAQWMAGPFASMVDRARDALGGTAKG
ncbi:hemerythrin [Streptomyces sulfonofaciens]|uniref:Hemerythrin n=1 Tax=Streptomyces sulfonofaciens TaxID=68272 RepID=A0A919GKA3_9ACTN|nr:hemerythrin domain-containing protein [Streptomyces sulfonofaciens]GHH86390.1 hemerythrin [Streptomyces sulfonofaciens]